MRYGLERHEGQLQRIAREFQQRSIPVYGLSMRWRGARCLRGAENQMTISHQDGRVLARQTTYTVEHGERDNAAAPFVTVTTTDDPPPPLAWSLAVAAGRARSPTPPEEEAAADAVESQVGIDVDGVTVSFKTMRLYGRVSGWAAVKDVTVSYVSRGLDVPRVGLAEITDLEPYIEGYRELMRDKDIEPNSL